jgi:hypothetical protein
MQGGTLKHTVLGTGGPPGQAQQPQYQPPQHAPQYHQQAPQAPPQYHPQQQPQHAPQFHQQAAQPQQQPMQPAPGGFGNQTVMGVAPAAQLPQHAFAKQTVLGGARAPQQPSQHAVSPTQPDPLPHPAPPSYPPAAKQRLHDAQLDATSAQEGGLVPPQPGDKRTMLGIARPGIAPLHPGVAKSDQPPAWIPREVEPYSPGQHAAAPQVATPQLAAYAAPPVATPQLAAHAAPRSQGEQLTEEELAVLPGHRAKSAPNWLVVSLLLGCLLLVALALVAFFVMRSGPELRARVQVEDGGGEVLELECPECADNTVAVLGSRRSTFKQQRAVLALEQTLRIGSNELEIRLDPPGESTQIVELNVPVEYRVRADVTGLERMPPTLAVRVTAVPETTIVVNGKTLRPGSDGSASYEIDVSRDLTGPAATTQTLERRVSYVITPPSGAPKRDQVTFQLAVVPLLIEAPGESIVVESPHFMLAGRTQKGAALSVAGRPINVEADGKFAQLMSVSDTGETTISVKASAPGRAPRIVPIKVSRVESLAEHAGRFRQNATTDYDVIASDIERKRGSPVALRGTVAEARVERHTTLILLEAKSGCENPPCFARVVHGANTPLAKGNSIGVYGRISGTVEGARSGTRIPEIRADFIVKER